MHFQRLFSAIFALASLMHGASAFAQNYAPPPPAYAAPPPPAPAMPPQPHYNPPVYPSPSYYPRDAYPADYYPETYYRGN